MRTTAVESGKIPQVPDNIYQLQVAAEHDGLRLDRYLVSALSGASRKVVRRLLDAGAVSVDGRRRRKGDRISEGDAIRIEGYIAPDAWSPKPDTELEVPVVYLDEDLIVVDKPAGVACHPLKPPEMGTVASSLVSRFPELLEVGDVRREAGLVHRLDTSTSGVLVFARTRSAFDDLVVQIRGGDGTVKVYDALVEGDAGWVTEIDAPLEAKGRRVKVITFPEASRQRGQPARTEVRAIRRLGPFTQVEARITAGRRHQIRAHLASVGHPIAGDELYGASLPFPVERPFLHARSMELRSPSTGQPLLLETELAEDLAQALERLENKGE